MESGGELISTNWSIVENDGKSLWNINRDSTGTDYESFGVHKTKYTTYKCFKRYRSVIEFYDLHGNKLDDKSQQGYYSAVSISKDGRILKTLYLNEEGKLTYPAYTKWAKMTKKYYKNGTWRQRFYNSNNKPSCEVPIFEYHFQPDTVYFMTDQDTTIGFKNIVLKKRNCNKKIIK